MTMHLVGPYLTTTNFRTRKAKVTQAKINEWIDGHKQTNKQNKLYGIPQLSFEEYVDQLHGKGKREKVSHSMNKPSNSVILDRIRDHKKIYPSLTSSTDSNACAKKESQKYTGSLIKGIATMHKSNAVPVINEEQALEIARMRRG